MPLLHRRDDIKRRVVVTATGPFQAAHVFDWLERQRNDGTWTYGVLFDTRGMTGHATFDDVRLFMKRLVDTDAEPRPRGPLAVPVDRRERVRHRVPVRHARRHTANG